MYSIRVPTSVPLWQETVSFSRRVWWNNSTPVNPLIFHPPNRQLITPEQTPESMKRRGSRSKQFHTALSRIPSAVIYNLSGTTALRTLGWVPRVDPRGGVDLGVYISHAAALFASTRPVIAFAVLHVFVASLSLRIYKFWFRFNLKSAGRRHRHKVKGKSPVRECCGCFELYKKIWHGTLSLIKVMTRLSSGHD